MQTAYQLFCKEFRTTDGNGGDIAGRGDQGKEDGDQSFGGKVFLPPASIPKRRLNKGPAVVAL